MADTIYAPATAAGRAAIGVIRISGPLAAEAFRALSPGRSLPPPRRATLCRLYDPADGELLDVAVVIRFAAPKSYTGEDMLEIHHHGGLAVTQALMDALGRLPGLRLAEPGEFTKRAFLAGKLDLTEAEAVADLVEATTRAQARLALSQLDGALGRLCRRWREQIIAALSRIEAEIDFGAEEGDVPEDMRREVLALAAELRESIASHLADQRRGERLRAGITVAIVGPPNVGKSSLLNRLARREVAIVTPIPGTTRDPLEVALDLDGLPVVLVDTAGLRESADPVEREGVRRARERAEHADLRLHLLDPFIPESAWPEEDPCGLLVVNKVDLAPPPASPRPFLAVSCRTGAGMAELEARLRERAAELVGSGDVAVITRARHREALSEALDALDRVTADGESRELALLAEDLRIAARALGRVVGEIGVEDLLDRIFAEFCIGK